MLIDINSINRIGLTASFGLSVSIGLAAGQNGFVNAGPINFTVSFSEPATGFANADVSFTGSTVGGTPAAAVSGGPTTYNVAVTGMTGNGNVTISIPAGAVQTVATGANFPASNSATVVFDTTAPSVTINKGAGQADPTSASPILFDVVFSEAVTGFVSSDVTLTDGTSGALVGVVSGGAINFTVTVTGMGAANGNVTASIAGGVCTDLAGNANGASTSTDNIVAWVAPVGGGQFDFSDLNQSGELVLLEDI